MLKLLTLGGGGEIGANCMFLDIDGTGVILDCGIHPQKTGIDALPVFDLIKDKSIDYVLISHAHQDHIGSLPFLIKKYPHLKIVTTPQTRAIAELTLHNAVSIIKSQLNAEDIMPYTHDEIDLLIKSIDYKSYNLRFDVDGYSKKNDVPVKAEFFNAGHVLGSASILLEYKNERIFYTGDINLDKQALIAGAELPSQRVTTLILECTYGNTNSAELNSWDEEEKLFINAAKKVINTGGSILIPVFSLGKLQEMLTVLHRNMETGKLTKVPIYTGGIANKISRVYDYNRYVVKMNNPDFELSSVPQENFYEVENPDKFFRSPVIVLAPSGMMIESTASFKLARHWFRNSDAAIFTVGYVEKNTPIFKVANAKTGDKIKLADYLPEDEVKCQVRQFRFTAHSKREELLRIIQKLTPANVILHHGDEAAIEWMKEAIRNRFEKVKVFTAETGSEITIS